jgi:hypothetical protein
MDYLRTIDQANALVRAAGGTVQSALNIGQVLNADVTLATTFPNTTLGNQLRQVAKVIKFNATSPALGLRRQIFFCQLGGFDTHQSQLNTQSTLLSQIGNAISRRSPPRQKNWDLPARSRRSRCRTSGARCSLPARVQARSGPTTPGATITSSSAARSVAATSTGAWDRTEASSRPRVGRPQRHGQPGRWIPTVPSSSTPPRWPRGSAYPPRIYRWSSQHRKIQRIESGLPRLTM